MIRTRRYRQGFGAIIILLTMFSHASVAQDFPNVAAQESYCFDTENPIPISDFVTFIGDDDATLEGMQITISDGYDSTLDTLIYENSNAITGSFDDVNGILTLTGSSTLLVYKQVMREVFFFTEAPVESAFRSISVSLSNLDYLPETGHFYQYIPSSGILWTAAKDAAEAITLFGLTGYLATITTEAESDFLIERVAGSAWIGASDEASEGVWRWVTGPEGLEDNGQGRTFGGFINWNSGEPNNCCEGENYAHMMDWTSPPGAWNDLPDEGGGGQYNPTGYTVEFGGLPGDPDVFSEITGTTVLDPLKKVSITGPLSLCPNIRGAMYTATDLTGYSYVWVVDGGTIAAGQGTNEITVDWGDTNANAKVSVKAVSDIACEIDAELPVVINVQLEPPLPTGPDVICFIDLITPLTYSTLESPGSNYEWKITNGQITSGQGTNEVQVTWDGPGMGTLYFTESTSTATDICDGDSPLLNVDLRQEIVPTISLTPVSCFRGMDGAIAITQVTGAAPISLTYNTNGLGQPESNGVSNLPAGTYSVDILSDGCTINVPFTITEPTELTGTVQAMDALCFGEASGEAVVLATGGTGSYRYVWSITRPQDQAAIDRLPIGSYSVDVIDENNCVLTLNFDIDEPPLLVIESITSTLVTCPGGADGTLEAAVSGGTPPYSFSWEGSMDTEAFATGFTKGTFELIVTDANGCTVRGEQTVEEAIPKFTLPNAFTPNGDGENDTFGPRIACPFRYSLSIYNEWGALVFVTQPGNFRWDGTINGVEAPTGKYSYRAFWIIEANDQELPQEKVGTLRLFR